MGTRVWMGTWGMCIECDGDQGMDGDLGCMYGVGWGPGCVYGGVGTGIRLLRGVGRGKKPLWQRSM